METLPFKVIYQDHHIIAINKPANMPVQSDKTGDASVMHYLSSYFKHKHPDAEALFLELPHRIDRPTSGIVLIAQSPKALRALNKQFQAQKVTKTYWAVVRQLPEPTSGTLIHHLVRSAKHNKAFTFTEARKTSKLAKLHYKAIAQSDNYHLLEIEPETGRHHQIRAQLAAIGCPIKGDIKYGAKRTNKEGGIHLHAYSISFEHPTTKRTVNITAAPPENDAIWQYFQQNKQMSDIAIPPNLF